MPVPYVSGASFGSTIPACSSSPLCEWNGTRCNTTSTKTSFGSDSVSPYCEWFNPKNQDPPFEGTPNIE